MGPFSFLNVTRISISSIWQSWTAYFILLAKMRKQKHADGIKKLTIIFGYSLFVLLLLALVLFTIIPFGSILFDPAVRHFSVALSLTALIAGAVLPTLISYFFGDLATRIKSSTDRHFNGVLFGIAAYWLSNLFTFISSNDIEYVRKSFSEPLATAINGWPVLATVVVMSAVAIRYARQKKYQASLLESRSYQLVLFGGIVAVFAYALIYGFHPGSNSDWRPLLESVVVPMIFFGLSYSALFGRSITKSSRLTLAAVALSIGYIAYSVWGQLFSGVTPSLYPFLPLTIGFLILAMYLLLIHRAK